jgi:hypothetical protein
VPADGITNGPCGHLRTVFFFARDGTAIMIVKIISGGQTGVDRAALDAAIRLGIPHGGWIPKGRLTEDGPLPDTYALKETVLDGLCRAH